MVSKLDFNRFKFKSFYQEFERRNVDNIFIENFLIYYINTDNNALIEIKDNKTLSLARRREKVFIVLLDKNIKFNTIKDIKPLHEWYLLNNKENPSDSIID